MSFSTLPEISQTLNEDFFSFISNHLYDDPVKLRLNMHRKELSFDVSFALTQIESRKKTAKKLKHFIAEDKFLFPTTLSAEQASHQAVAKYHAMLISGIKGFGIIHETVIDSDLNNFPEDPGVLNSGPHNGSLLDMTAGLGIDAMTMSDNANETIAIELDTLKADILKYNSSLLGKKNITVVNDDSVEWINRFSGFFDTIFIDPARRKEDNSRVYNFHDCIPDILNLQDSLLSRCSRLLIKASPLLDVTQTLKDIRDVKAIRAVCVQGECKEILIEASALPGQLLYEAVDLNEEGEIKSLFRFKKIGDESALSANSFARKEDIEPGNYLYEPNAAVMKLAPWPELGRRFPGIRKLALSSHLFISSELFRDFPGRVLKIEKLIEKKDLKALKGLPVNVAIRNYPLSAVELRKKLGVKEGTDLFLYGTTLFKPSLILAKKIDR